MANIPAGTTGRSCTTCPAFLSGKEQTAVLGSNFSAPICGVKMLPLVMPRQGADTCKKVFTHVAKTCDKFGQSVVHKPLDPIAAPEFRVGMDTAIGEPDPADQGNANCHSCENFIDAGVVSLETGWTGSICRAKGILMPDSRLNQYSRTCGSYVRQVGPRHRASVRLATFSFFPQYGAGFGRVDEAAQYRTGLDNFIDPPSYPNERELTDKLRAMMARRGIRAWRRVVDPHGYGEDVYLPIYDASLLSDAEQALVPKTNDPEHPELYADHGQLLYRMAVLWMKLDETAAWWGQGGTGKTEFGRHLSWLMCLPFHRINITSSSEIDDIAGKMLFEKGETVFQYGRLPSAWKRPGIILLDEPNTGPPDVWQLIRPLTDNSKMLVLDQNKGEQIRRNTDCYFTLAMNPAWDPRNVGTQNIGDADGSRLMHIFFSYPPRDLEMEIVQRRVRLDGWEVPKDKMYALMNVSDELRSASDDGMLHSTWGVRHQIKVARALRWFPPVIAYKTAVGDYLEPAQWDIIHTVVKSHFGD